MSRGARGTVCRLRAPAKVNLHLEVLRQREDGYHEIETVLQAITLFDDLVVTLLERRDGAPLEVELDVEPFGAAPEDASNLCVRAAGLLARETGRGGRLRIELRKRIPAGAGLGGGSADAAAVLVACDRLLETGLAMEDLSRLAARLGMDVPFFLRGGTQLGRGRGEELTPLSPIRRGRFLVLVPPFALATAEIYGQLNMGLTTRGPKANIGYVESLIARFPGSSWFGGNRLEEVVLPAHPELQRVLVELRRAAPIAMLSGSGSALYAVFPDSGQPHGLLERLVPEGWRMFEAGPHPAGVVVTEG